MCRTSNSTAADDQQEQQDLLPYIQPFTLPSDTPDPSLAATLAGDDAVKNAALQSADDEYAAVTAADAAVDAAALASATAAYNNTALNLTNQQYTATVTAANSNYTGTMEQWSSRLSRASA